MGQITVFSGAERRRRWSMDEKRTLVAAAFAPGAIVSDVARAADLRANQIYRWRRDLGLAHAAEFAAVMVGTDSQDRPASTTPVSPAAAMVIEIGRARVQVMANAPLALVTTTLRLLAR
ncbi:MAG: transposase [Tardiphaga sp.]|uniref:IS66-like element accessory protein TnpA n=1 Tax=Tardiphaga sp. TaxID=1926292 RepID=UPI001987D414|nr:transposase [Tardiphaga sp.]MBC7584992.1 transposase [Tardiphaga sp.]